MVSKNWIGGLEGEGGKEEKGRASVPHPAIETMPQDIDPVTGALRWDRFQVMLQAERAQGPGVLLIVDLTAQSGKAIAATGQEGDEVLPWLAQAIRKAIRADDLLAHVEGYRFAALLRGAPEEIGSAISERILESVDDTIFMTAEGLLHLVVTVGGAVYEQVTGVDVMDAALANLGVAKASGRTVLVR